MTITITIKCDNAAFYDEAGGGTLEVHNILRNLANRFADVDELAPDTWGLRDSNGNKVGTVEITD